MRSIFILFFLFFLFNEAHGILLGNYGMMQPVQLLEKALEKEIIPMVAGFSKSTLSLIEHSNLGRNSRKLLIATSPSSPGHYMTRNEEGNKKEKGMLKAKDLENNNNNHLEAELEHYPDFIEIEAMDYSPARRKTPIHN